MTESISEPLQLVTDERLDVVFHRGWFDVHVRASLPAIGDAVAVLSSDRRWGLLARVAGVGPAGDSRVRIALDRRSCTMYARTPVDEGSG